MLRVLRSARARDSKTLATPSNAANSPVPLHAFTRMYPSSCTVLQGAQYFKGMQGCGAAVWGQQYDSTSNCAGELYGTERRPAPQSRRPRRKST